MSAGEYWASYAAPVRQEILQAVGRLVPFSSLLEVGAHCGPNLRNLVVAWPDVTYTAIDRHEPYVTWGREHLPMVTWQLGTAPGALAGIPDGSVDVVLDSSCLDDTGNTPELQTAMLTAYRRIAARGIVHLIRTSILPMAAEVYAGLAPLWAERSRSGKHQSYTIAVWEVTDGTVVAAPVPQ